jgi:hypothetical protein
MYKPKVFLIGENQDELVALAETGFLNEDRLQELLADYPDLLPGDQIDPENPRRWLLVTREMGISDGTSEVGRWSLDHLFLDQDGIPTFVECKRASDNRIRREVVGQMLDYAANGTAYWTVDQLRQAAIVTAGSRETLDETVTDLLGGEEQSIEEYWEKVKTNLQNHLVRLVFVSDSTPQELRQIVEFLNKEMENVEVLAVEVKQYQGIAGTGQKVLAPRLVNLTVREPPHISPQPPMTFDEFLRKCASTAVRGFFQRLFGVADTRHYTIYRGQVGFSIRVKLSSSRSATFLYVTPEGSFQFFFDSWLRGGEAERFFREELPRRGIFEEHGKWTLATVVNEDNLMQLEDAYTFIMDEIDKRTKDYIGELT